MWIAEVHGNRAVSVVDECYGGTSNIKNEAGRMACLVVSEVGSEVGSGAVELG